MRRRLLSLAMALAMALSLLPTVALAENTEAEPTLPEVSTAIDQDSVAAIGDTGYSSIDTAIAAAGANDIVVLQQNITATVNIPENKAITLNLNGHDITVSDGDAILNKGTLTIQGSGTVSTNASNCAAIANIPGATCTVNGGTYKSDKWYVIKNLGAMVIDGDVTVTTENEDNVSSLVDNGWVSSADTVGGSSYSPSTNSVASLTIQEGSFQGKAGQKSCSVIKNDDCGVLVINGGTFDSTNNTSNESATTIINWNRATINGGTFTGSYPLSNGYCDATKDIGELTISGGNFTGTNSSVFGQCIGADSNKGKITVMGGIFQAQNLGGPFTYEIELQGGTFTVSTPDLEGMKDLCAAGYECVVKDIQSAPTTYTIQKITDKLVIEGSVSGSGESVSVNGSLEGSFAAGVPVEDNVSDTEEGASSVTGNDVTVSLKTKADGTTATTTTLTVLEETAVSLGNANSLTLTTDVGDVTLDNKALDKISLAESAVEIKVQKVNDITGTNIKAAYAVSVQANSKDLLPAGAADNGIVTISVPVDSNSTDLYAWYVQRSEDSVIYVEKLTPVTAEEGYFAFQISHLSEVVIVEGEVNSNVIASTMDQGGNIHYYDDLQKAIDAAPENGVVELLDDAVVSVPEDTADDVVTGGININKNITINGNNYSIKAGTGFDMTTLWNTTPAGKYHVINITGGTVTLNYLTVDGDWNENETESDNGSAARSGINIWQGNSTVNLNNVTVQNCSVYGVVVNGSGSQVNATNLNVNATNRWGVNTDNGGNVNMNSGTIDKDFVVEDGTATISGGTFNAVVKTQGSSVSEGALKITGGTFNYSDGTNGSVAATDSANNNTISISGGTFATNVSTYCADGLTTTVENGKYTIAPAEDAVALLKAADGSTVRAYDTDDGGLAQALKDATDGQTVVLLDNIEVNLTGVNDKSGALVINKNITLDGNKKYKITATGTTENDVHVIVTSGSDVTIKNLEVDGADVAHYGIQAFGDSAKLTLENVNSHGNNAYGIFANHATVEATDLTTSDNEWGGVNVDNGGKLTIHSGNLQETYSVVIEGTGNAATLNGGTYNNIQVKTNAGQTNTLTITGGNYTDIVGANVTGQIGEPVKEQTKVEGGNFQNSVADVATTPDYEAKRSSGTYPYSYHDNLEEAIAAAGSGGTVTEVGETTTHTVTLVYNNGTANQTLQVSGGQISLPTPTRNGYTFAGWSSSLGGTYTGTVTISSDVTFTALWNSTSSPSYSGGSSTPSYSNTIEVGDGGDVKVSPRTPEAGDTVTITPDPDAGYEVDEVIVTDRNGDEVEVTANRNGTYTFKQPRGRVTIEVTFVRTDSGLPFIDVAANAWYYDAVAYAYENGLMSGTASNLFSPNATTTRGMIVTMLYRLEGEPRVTTGSAFNDVDAAMYYADAIAWANANGIVTGYDEATFGPNDAITREQMAAILYRYAQYKAYRTTASADLSGYVDADAVSAYALPALQWASAEGLVTGTSSTTLTPDGSATRAQVATIFMRFMEDVAE